MISTVFATGLNADGQLGLGHTSNVNTPTRVIQDRAMLGTNISMISAQYKRGYAISNNNRIFAWGLNTNFELADLTKATRNSPIQSIVPHLLFKRKIKQFVSSSFASHNLILTTDGRVFAWGLNNYGQLGDGSTISKSVAMMVGSLENVEIVHIAAGQETSHALSSDGVVYSWGRGTYCLGTGNSGNKYTPTPIDSNGILRLKFIVKISCKNIHVLALSMDGEVFSWGNNANGKLGDGTTISSYSPVAVDMSPFGGKKVVDIYAGGSFSAALTEEGKLFSWGQNSYYALGDGTSSHRFNPTPVYNSGALLNVKLYDASLGDKFGLALGTDGTNHKVFAWGANQDGQLGIGNTANQRWPVQTMEGYRVTQISAGEANSLFFVGPVTSCYGKFGALACNHPWGTCVANNTCLCIKEFTGTECSVSIFKCFSKSQTTGCNAPRGQCVGPDLCKCTDGWAGQECQDMICHGKYPNVACSYPNGLCTGPNHCTCNTGWKGVECEIPICFGMNGTFACNYPNGVCIGPDTCSCTGGYYGNQCQFSAFVYAAGYGTSGQLGTGNTTNSNTFVKIDMSSGLAGVNVTQVIGLKATSMVISNDGKLYGWGSNTNSELYDGTTDKKTTPIALKMDNSFFGKKIKKIASGIEHSHIMALTTDGEVFAWGANNYGQLGDGSQIAKTVPIRVRAALENEEVIDIAVGNGVSFAHTKDGKLYSWGRGGQGLLGNGGTADVLTPTLIQHDGVLNRKFITKISCQHSHMLIITYDLKAYAWGLNTNGRLGDGSTTQRNEPVQVKGDLIGKKVIDVSAGGDFSLAITNDSIIYSWGSNSYGSLGDNSTVLDRKVPQMIYMDAFLDKSIVQIATGASYAMVLTGDGNIYVWGRNYGGSLGIGTGVGSINLPTKVPTDTIGKIGYISIGAHHSLIITRNFLTCFNKSGYMACAYPNGYCKDYDVCECNPGFEGVECEISLYSCYDKPFELACNIPNGVCASHDVCICEYGYIGLECEDYTCYGKPSAVACSMHGKCASVDNCECDEGWTGYECDIPICYGRTLTAACNYPNGQCTNPNTCTCINYVGKECTTPKCYDKMGPEACNYPHGSCIGPNTCQCELGYFGDECTQYGCYGEPVATACNYPYGECVGPDNCNCTEGYGTHICLPICYGLTGPSACNGKGQCESPDNCVCNSGWAGNECDTPICFGKNGTDACTQNGICVESNTCLCFDEFFGAECSLYLNSSTKEYPIESGNIEIFGQGFSSTLAENSVTLQMGEHVFPSCTITFVNYTMIRCSVSGLSLGPLHGIVSVKGYASKKTRIATITGTVLVTESKELIPGYTTSLIIKGNGFAKNSIEMTVELSQYMDTPMCTVTSSDETWLSCSLTGLTNGPLFARVARNGIYSTVVQVATVDNSPPIKGKVKILPDYSTSFGYYTQSSRTTIAATWNEFFDSGIGISHYEVAIYDNYLVLRPFKNVGKVDSVLFTGLYLSIYKRYTIKVRAVDKFGYVSEPAESEPVEIIPKPLIPIEIPKDIDVFVTNVYLQTFSLRLEVPKNLYSEPYFNERLVLEPIKTFDNVTFMDPMETIPRMIGFTLTNPLTYQGFAKPLRVVISFLSVAHLLNPEEDELVLKYYDPWHKLWRRANETCREFDKEEIVEETDYKTFEHTATFCHLTQFSLFLAVNETFDNLTDIIGPPPGYSPPPPAFSSPPPAFSSPPPAYSSPPPAFSSPPPAFSSPPPAFSSEVPPGYSSGAPPPGHSSGVPPPGHSSGVPPPPHKSTGDQPQPGTSESPPRGTSSSKENPPPTQPPEQPEDPDNETSFAGLDANTILLLVLMTVIATIIAGVLLVNTVIFLIMGRRGEEYIPMLDNKPTVPPSLPIMTHNQILIPDEAITSFRTPRELYQVDDDNEVYERELEEIARPMNDMYLETPPLPPPPPPPPEMSVQEALEIVQKAQREGEFTELENELEDM
jgi:alpha-tubulin suppressor-like RCC1 family protein